MQAPSPSGRSPPDTRTRKQSTKGVPKSLIPKLPSSALSAPPRITGNDIPDDIWRLIAEHLEDLFYPFSSDFHALISVNRSFFHYILFAKYREVRWVKLDRKFMHLLKRLQSPIIAGHVRRLYIRAWFIDYLLKRDALFKEPSTSKVARLLKSALCFQDPQDDYKKARKEGKLMGPHNLKEIINSLITAVNGMTNVTVFNFEWRDLPLNKETRIFLTSTRTAFAASLRKLVLRAQISKFKELLALTNFENIDELDFHFDYRVDSSFPIRQRDDAPSPSQLQHHVNDQPNPHPGDTAGGPTLSPANDARSNHTPIRDPDARDVMDTIIPFINYRKESLRSLRISSSSSIDLSEFFNALPHLPNLRRFGVHISFDKASRLSDPSGMLRLLHSSARSLLHISFAPTWPDHHAVNISGRTDALKHKRREWTPINNKLLAAPATLSSLESLEIPYLSSSQTIPLIQRSADTLTSLTLTDRFLTLEEVTEVVGLFAHRPFEMQHLHVEVIQCGLGLFQMLATRLPDLYSLVVVFSNALDADELFTPPNSALADWKLRELSVYQGRIRLSGLDDPYTMGVLDILEADYMLRLTALVPSIQRLNGLPKGHK